MSELLSASRSLGGDALGEPSGDEPSALPSSFRAFRLREETLAALDALGITTPTPIQGQAIPALLDGHDVVGQARTGSGKTLAFGLPLVEMVDPERKAVQALVLTPTRELASQVAKVIQDISAGRDINVVLLYGGTAPGPQRSALRKGAQVVVGTPGRVLDLLSQGALWLDQVRFLVLDEADEMFDQGFAQDVERIMDRTSNSRQTALFSATMPEWVRKTARRYLYDPVTITIDAGTQPTSTVPHVAFEVPVPGGSRRRDDEQQAKFRALRDLLDHRGPGATIVFGRTKQGVQLLARKLEHAGYPVAGLQGNLTQAERNHVMEAFKSGRVDILVATNVAARGLDLLDVTLVINYELPESAELLTHRVGRTGRMGRTGGAITLLSPSEVRRWNQLTHDLGNRIERLPWRGAEHALATLRGERTEDQPATESALSSPERDSAVAHDVSPPEVKPGAVDEPSGATVSAPSPPTHRRHGAVRHRSTLVDHGAGGAEAHVRQAARRAQRPAPEPTPPASGPRRAGTVRPPWVLDAATRVARWQRGEPAVRGPLAPPEPTPNPGPTASNPAPVHPKPTARPHSPTLQAPRVSAEPLAYAPIPAPKGSNPAPKGSNPAPKGSSPATTSGARAASNGANPAARRAAAPPPARQPPMRESEESQRRDTPPLRASNQEQPPTGPVPPVATRPAPPARKPVPAPGDAESPPPNPQPSPPRPQPSPRAAKPKAEREGAARQPASSRSASRVATSRCVACGAPIAGGGRYCADCARELQRLNQQSDGV